ncbi:MAG: cysteine synthase family protein [Candidatus Peribacteraceae bacterium]|nr:cysteine synthase family protein [Candidatus Peribacteraceae bacterium]
MKKASSITEIIGNTPVVEYPVSNPNWQLFLKLEKCNPGQSMKDRMAMSMIEAAERDGRLHPGGTIIESSSGNTGTGLAMIAASKGYKFIAVVDHHAAKEKIDIMRAYGAEIVFVDSEHADGKIAVNERETMAARLSHEIPNSFFGNQADNPANPLGYGSLAEEILQQVHDVRVLFGAIGTGGSLCGTARALKEKKPDVQAYAVEPRGSIIFGGPGGPYFQSGTGNPPEADIPKNVDYEVIDGHYKVSDREAFNTARFAARNTGILIGGSAGGVLYKALEQIHGRTGAGKMVAIMADGGEKYTSTIFNDEWMSNQRLLDASVEVRLRLFTALRNGK